MKCDCLNKKVRDSLIRKYIVNGAEKNDYNGPAWQQYCDSLIALCPGIAVAYQHKAIPFIKMGDYAKAFPLEDRAVELDPLEYTSYRGFLKCIFTKDYEGAILDFQKAQELSPDNYVMDHTCFFYEGLCNLELGKYPEAEQNLIRDISIQTGGDKQKESGAHYNSLMYLGIVYYEMGMDEKAKKYLTKCLAYYKELPEANYYMAMVYKKENNPELRFSYLEIAKRSKSKGFGLNEDNVYYANYPHEITLSDIEKELAK